jgi:hypothetical protein
MEVYKDSETDVGWSLVESINGKVAKAADIFHEVDS